MGKGKTCIVVYSFGMIVVFIAMLYLMTTVNPPPIPLDDVPDNALIESHKLDNMLMNDAVLPLVETAQFGLEKIDADEIDFFQSTSGPTPKYNRLGNLTGVFRFTPRKIIAPLWPRATQTIIIDPTMHIVMPPIWPSSFDKLDSSSTTIKVPVNESLDSNVEKRENKIKPERNKTVVKSMKRRSVNDYVSNDNQGSVILKILDNEAQSRIEIKLGSDVVLKNTKSKGIMNLIGRKKFAMQSEFNHHGSSNLAKDTIISIMPNDTVIIDEFDSQPVADKEYTDIKNLISSMISKPESNEERNFPFYEDKAIIDNTTKYFKDIVANSSNFDIINGSTINNIKTSVTHKNGTDYGTMANTTINNTEFIKRAFEEEEINTNIVHKPENYTMFIHDAVSNNYTDVLFVY